MRLIIAICISQLAGLIGSLFTMEAVSSWYVYVLKPAIAPPNWVFGPVWITLFTLMGIAAFLVWEQGSRRRDVRFALKLFGVQLVLNTGWSIIFFGLQSPGWAFVEIVILLAAIIATTVTFFRISRMAGILLVPYILWVSFAAYLNYAIYQLNRLT